MIEWNWDTCRELRSKPMYDFLFAIHDKPISEDDFVTMYTSVPQVDGRGNRAPSHARRQYRYIKKRFGWFGGVE